jgi:ribosomal protein S18 acetylase RimI-like enzyme
VPIVRLTWEDGAEPFRQLTALHIAEIHHGALPLLGPRFMTRLYRELARTPGCFVWAALDGIQVGAFLIGCTNLRASFRKVLLRAGLILALIALPRLLSWGLLRMLPALFLYPFRQPRTESTVQAAETHETAELLAIAVAPTCRGQGLGRALVLCLEEALRAHGAIPSYRVSTNTADPASNAFYRRLGFEPIGIAPHHNLYLQHYRKSLARSTMAA